MITTGLQYFLCLQLFLNSSQVLDNSPTFSWLQSEPNLKYGFLPEKPFSIKSRTQVFLSSTFDDTKNEQDYLLVNAFPFLREEICRPLALDFDIVTMRYFFFFSSSPRPAFIQLYMQQIFMNLQLYIQQLPILLFTYTIGSKSFFGGFFLLVFPTFIQQERLLFRYFLASFRYFFGK